MPADGMGAAPQNGTSACPAGSSVARLHQLSEHTEGPCPAFLEVHRSGGSNQSVPILVLLLTHALFGFDIGLANDAAIVDRLPAKISREIRAAGPDRIETLDDKLLSDLGNLHRGDEPVRKLRYEVF